MNMKFKPVGGSSLALLCVFSVLSMGVAGEPLSWTVTETRMPIVLHKHGVVYDGHDSIYIVGGLSTTGTNGQVFEYSLETGLIHTHGQMAGRQSAGTFLYEDYIYMLGGSSSTAAQAGIYRYSLNSTLYYSMGSLPSPRNHMSPVWDPVHEVMYTFGGYSGTPGLYLNTILRYDPAGNQVTQVGNIGTGRYHATSIWADGAAYIFGGSTGQTHGIYRFNPETGNVTTLATLLPKPVSNTCSVYVPVERVAYIFVANGLLRFYPATRWVQEVQVDSSWVEGWSDGGCVYVEEVDRIYVFGGNGRFRGESSTRIMDEISYIQLEGRPVTVTEVPTTEPTTEPEWPTTTYASLCPPTGVHTLPYPGNCTLYIKCFDGQAQVLSCYPLIFDKVDLICKAVDEAVCDEEDPPNQCPPEGYETFPHPSNCSLYFECFIGNQYESECAAHTYFDISPEILHCNQAEVATCHAECAETGIQFLPIRTAGCRWYKVCLEGVSANLQCGEGEIFDPVESRCVGVGNYICPYSD